MRPAICALALLLATTLWASGCGKYGKPVRRQPVAASRPAAAATEPSAEQTRDSGAPEETETPRAPGALP